MTLTQLQETLTSAQRRDPNHHLWRNGRFWWIAFTVHTPDYRTHRLRFSLKTEDLEEARERRDRVFSWYTEREDVTLSLRVAKGRARAG